MKNSYWLFILSLSSLIVLILSNLPMLSNSIFNVDMTRDTILEVGDGKPYQSIGDAINDSSPGDTILIFEGTYRENVQLNSKVSLIGNKPGDIIIEGSNINDTISINCDECTIINLTITSNNKNYTGINISSNGNIINKCVVMKNRNGICIDSGDGNRIINNSISMNLESGIVLKNSNNNMISNNTISNNIENGLIIIGSSDNRIFGNNFNPFNRESLIDPTLIGFWKMDEPSWNNIYEEVKDSSSYYHNGTPKNGAVTVSSEVSLRAGQFDGINDYVSIPDKSILRPQTFTISTWIRLHSSIDHMNIVSKRYTDSPYYSFGLKTSSKRAISFVIGLSGQEKAINTDNYIVEYNKWYHLTCTRDGVHMRIYINGLLQDCVGDTGLLSGIINYNSNNINIASYNNNLYFDGEIDEVRIYNRALLHYEIIADMGSQKIGINTIDYSQRNIIKMNNFVFNSNYGLRIDSTSSSNLIFHNNMINNGINSIQAHDSGNANKWENEEGNYWSHFTSPDANNDGLVDVYLEIDGTAHSKDRYPFVKTFGTLRIYGSSIIGANEDQFFSEKYYQRGIEGKIKWSIQTTEDWLSLLPGGEIVGIPTNEDVGSNQLLLEVSDGDTSTEMNIKIEVNNINDPPTILTEDQLICNENEDYQVEYEAMDIDPTQDILFWNLKTDAIFLSMNGSSLFGLPGDMDVGTFWVNISVFDNWGGIDYSNFSLLVLNENDPPKIVGSPTLIVLEDTYYLTDFNVTDPDPDDDHTWYLNSNVSFLSLDPKNGTISGIPDNSNVGEQKVEIVVSDIEGELDRKEFNITVINVNDPPRILNDFPDNLMEDREVDIPLVAIDIDPTNDQLTWTMETNASFLSISDYDWVLRGIPTNDDVGNYYITVNVSDGLGGYNENKFNFSVLNVNDPPELKSSPIGIEIQEDSHHSERIFPDWFDDVDNDMLDIDINQPNHLYLSLTKDFILNIEPLENWNGEEIITLSASDGEFSVDWSVTVKVISLNDAPSNISITIAKKRFRQNEDIIISGNALDVDLEYGDELIYSWYTEDYLPLGNEKIQELNLDPGKHIIILNVTDNAGSGLETSITIDVYEENTFLGSYGIVIVIFPIISLITLLVILGVLIMKKLGSKEVEVQEEVEDGASITGIGVADGYSSSIVSGGELQRQELQPIMLPPEEILPPQLSEPFPEETAVLPPATVEPQQPSAGSEYLRPVSDPVRRGFKASPIPSEIPSEIIPLETTPPTISSQGDQMAEDSIPSASLPPSEQPEVDAKFNSPVWSPEMVETRLASDAKSAVEILHELNELKNEGAITEEEYNIYKKRLLRKI